MQEGIEIHYKDDNIPAWMLEAHHEKSLVVYTPAIPESNQGIEIFQSKQFSCIQARRGVRFCYSRYLHNCGCRNPW